MKASILVLLSISVYFKSLSQTPTLILFTDARPEEFDNNNTLIQKNGIVREMIYRYKKSEKNKDSTLVVINYFDSLGNKQEKDEYDETNVQPRQITNYYYVNNLLTKQERQTLGSINNFIVNTYEYDSAGNKIVEKNYSLNQNKSFSLQEVRKWEYDKGSRIIKIFDKLYDNEMYLYNTYHYDADRVKEIKTYDLQGKWIYSYLNEYDTFLKKESVYLDNESEKKLEHESFYNSKKQLIRKIYHYVIPFARDYFMNTFEYYEDGLVYKQKLQLINGANIYFKHFYFLQ
jgi:hypothetical protein